MVAIDRRDKTEIMTTELKLEGCKRARKIAADSLYSTLDDLLREHELVSEVDLRDRWRDKMREHPEIYEDGWYISKVPPPDGMGVLFGTTNDPYGGRMNYQSVRQPEMRPREDVILDRENGIIYLYASPVDKETGMIGDFGVVLYFGKDAKVIEHLKKCWRINQQIFQHATVGMPFGELAKFASELINKNGFSSTVGRTTNLSDINIGHTVPGSLENDNWTPQELVILHGSDWEQILKMISNKRKFISADEPHIIRPGAMTLEPRLTVPGDEKIPMSSFHSIIIFNPDGRKELLTNYEKIFPLVGMNYMLK